MKIYLNHKIALLVIIAGLFLTTFLVYFPGLGGGYLLDDEVNLVNLNVFANNDGLDAFIRYIMSDQSGTFKRPITTLSFLLNADSWPANPYYFKLTNVLIHLLNGALIYLVLVKLLEQFKIQIDKIHTIAIITMAFWLLHPFLVSTTLYVVQRMAMLPATFILLGMFFYLKGRKIILQDKNKGRYFMFIGAYIFTILAVLSKENGIILPVVLLLLEFVLPNNPKTYNRYKSERKLFLIIPSLIILIAFVYKIPGFIDSYSMREFTAIERLLTQTRVLTTYLYHLFIPGYFTEGVYSDGFSVSKSLLHPITTLFSMLFIFTLIVGAFLVRKKHPILSFSILFFFTTQLIESSVVNLELYFEHRNYLPSMFLFLPLSVFLIRITKYSKLFYIFPILIISVLAYFTHLTTQIWGDNYQLNAQTAQKFPSSYRAVDQRSMDFFLMGKPGQAKNVLENSLSNHKNVSLRIKLFILECIANKEEVTDADVLVQYIKTNKVRRLDKASLSGLLNSLNSGNCGPRSLQISENIIETIKINKGYRIGPIRQTINFSDGILNIHLGNIEKSSDILKTYLSEFEGYDDLMFAINIYVQNKHYKAALKLINQMKNTLVKRGSWYLKKDYLSELENAEIVINEMSLK